MFTADSGYEQRNVDWSSSRAEYDVSQGIKQQDQMDELTAFFYARRGKAYGFRFKDWNDFTLKSQSIGVGDGKTTNFQVKKTYVSGYETDGTPITFDRKITKLAPDTVAGLTVGGKVVDPATYTVNANTGVISFAQAPAGSGYSGTAPATALAYTSPSAFSDFPLDHGCGPVPDALNGFFYTLGVEQGGPRGIRQMDLVSGACHAEKKAGDLGVYTVTGLVCCLGDGSLVISAGASACQKMYKVSPALVKGVSWGADRDGAPDASTCATPGIPGCASNDGTRFIRFDTSAAGGRITVHEAAGLSYLKTVGTGVANPISTTYGGACPLDTSAFAILVSDGANLTLQDDAGIVLRTFPVTGAIPSFCVWDAGDLPGVVFGWTDGSGEAFCAKVQRSNGDEVWRIPLPAAPSSGLVNTAAAVANLFALKCGGAGGVVAVIDTKAGAMIPIAAPKSTPEYQCYNGTRNVLAVTGSRGLFDAILAVDPTKYTLVGGVDVSIGYAEFHVPVRFDNDHLDAVHEFWNTQTWQSIPLVEVRDWSDVIIAPSGVSGGAADSGGFIPPPVNPNSIKNSSYDGDFLGFGGPASLNGIPINYGINLTTGTPPVQYFSATRNVVYASESYGGPPPANEQFGPPIVIDDSSHCLGVAEGDNVYARALVAIHRIDQAIVAIVFFNAAFGVIAQVQVAAGGTVGGGVNGDNFAELWGYATAPAQAAYARISVIAEVGANKDQPTLFVAEQMLSKQPKGQTTIVAYTPGDPDNSNTADGGLTNPGWFPRDPTAPATTGGGTTGGGTGGGGTGGSGGGVQP